MRRFPGLASARGLTQLIGGDPPQPSIQAPIVSTVTGLSVTAETIDAAIVIKYISYEDDIDLTTIANSNLTVGNGASLVVAPSTNVISGTEVDVTYSIRGPGGQFDYLTNGSYSIDVNSDEVADDQGNFVASQSLGNLVINISEPSSPVVDAFSSGTITSDTTNHDVVITYTSDNFYPIDQDDIATSNITVSGGATVVSTSINEINPNDVEVTYGIQGPGGSWDSGDNGSYDVSIVANEITDGVNFVAAGVAGSITCDISAVTSPSVDSTTSYSATNTSDVGSYVWSHNRLSGSALCVRLIFRWNSGSAGSAPSVDFGGQSLVVEDSDTPGGVGKNHCMIATLDPGVGPSGVDNITVNLSATDGRHCATFSANIIDTDGSISNAECETISDGGDTSTSKALPSAKIADSLSLGFIGLSDGSVAAALDTGWDNEEDENNGTGTSAVRITIGDSLTEDTVSGTHPSRTDRSVGICEFAPS